jgi:Putative DNA-binding domain
VKLGSLNFEAISEKILQAMVSNGVAEGTGIEFKEETYGRTDSDIKEFLKDISSFANTFGGYLVIGMAENEGIAANLKGIRTPDIDAELQRFESLMRDGIQPRISGIQLKPISLATGAHAIVFNIPRSWNPPHRVSAKNTNRFYIRNSSGVHEASVEELRLLFSQAGTIQDRSRAYRHERLAKIQTGEIPVDLANHLGKLVVHIVPFSSFSSPTQVDLEFAVNNPHDLIPMGQTSGYSPTINFDGFINIRGGDQCFGYTQLFRDGRIEAVKVRVMMEQNGSRIIPSLTIDQHLLMAIESYMLALQKLNVAPPFIVMISLLEVRGAILGVGNSAYFDLNDPIRQNELLLPEILISQFGTPQDYQKNLRPAFDALWNAGGFSKSQHFAADGTWTGSKVR